jgi:hypothetical protein
LSGYARWVENRRLLGPRPHRRTGRDLRTSVHRRDRRDLRDEYRGESADRKEEGRRMKDGSVRPSSLRLHPSEERPFPGSTSFGPLRDCLCGESSSRPPLRVGGSEESRKSSPGSPFIFPTARIPRGNREAPAGTDRGPHARVRHEIRILGGASRRHAVPARIRTPILGARPQNDPEVSLQRNGSHRR